MLLELKQYLEKSPTSTLTELSIRFKTSEGVIRSMLQRLGKPIQNSSVVSPCGGCQSACGSCPLKQMSLSKKIPIDDIKRVG